MVIPEEAERKIRFLCNNIPNVEWSGVLFYKVNGSFEDKSLIITCVDIFQMDEGNAVYTEYDMSPDVVTYICDHPELADAGVYQSLIHSHNSMSSFFSSTDTNTLREEGNDMPHFVSLIVNNAGSYTAAITRKVKAVKDITISYTYPTWGGTELKGQSNYTSQEEYVEYFFLDIDKASNSFESEMSDRIKEIRKSKENRRAAFNQKWCGFDEVRKPQRVDGYSMQVKAPSVNMAPKQAELPFEGGYEEYPYGRTCADKKVVNSLVKQIVTASVIIPNSSQIDVQKWALNMDRLYKERFGDIESFESFASNYIDFLINDTDPLIDPQLADDLTERDAILAFDVREELTRLPNNPWLDVYIKMLDDYIL